jgi:hypothetical protein
MTTLLFLAGTLLGVALPVQAEKGPEKPVLPGEPGYVLKRAREMVELARCRDAEGRTDLLVSQARERLREREALGAAPLGGERAAVARGLGDSYRHLALEGGAGTLECGVAEGRPMHEAQSRYLERIAEDRVRWEKLVSSLHPRDRSREEAVLEVASEAPHRARAARAAGLEFLEKERARRAANRALRQEAPEPPRPERSKPEAERPRKDEGTEMPAHPEHHPPHPHRPHH